VNILLVLVPVSLVLLGLAVWAFFWAADDGQFDDLDTPALSPLTDDAPQRADDEPRSP
jgi:cbb3-type cytochrome oxidase maturation protein